MVMQRAITGSFLALLLAYAAYAQAQSASGYKNTKGFGFSYGLFEPGNRELDKFFGTISTFSINGYSQTDARGRGVLNAIFSFGFKRSVQSAIFFDRIKSDLGTEYEHYSNSYLMPMSLSLDLLYQITKKGKLRLLVGAGAVWADMNLKKGEPNKNLSRFGVQSEAVARPETGFGTGAEAVAGLFYIIGKFNVQFFVKYQTNTGSVVQVQDSLGRSLDQPPDFQTHGLHLQIGINLHN